MWIPMNLTAAEVKLIHEFLEELDALVDADDGTCFSCKHLDQLSTIKEIMGFVPEEDVE